jgi:hypothetical protein
MTMMERHAKLSAELLAEAARLDAVMDDLLAAGPLPDDLRRRTTLQVRQRLDQLAAKAATIAKCWRWRGWPTNRFPHETEQ